MKKDPQEIVVKKAINSFSSQIKNLEMDEVINIAEMYFNQLFSIGEYYGKRPRTKGKKVYQYQNGKYIRTYGSLSEAARVYNVNKTTIYRSIKYKREVSGYLFCYTKKVPKLNNSGTKNN